MTRVLVSRRNALLRYVHNKHPRGSSLAVACAPPSLGMTEGEGIAEIDDIARHRRERNVKSVDHNEHERRQGDCDYTIQNDRHPEWSPAKRALSSTREPTRGILCFVVAIKTQDPSPLLPPQRTKRALGAPVRQMMKTLAR
jgi:hypothetical protein